MRLHVLVSVFVSLLVFQWLFSCLIRSRVCVCVFRSMFTACQTLTGVVLSQEFWHDMIMWSLLTASSYPSDLALLCFKIRWWDGELQLWERLDIRASAARLCVIVTQIQAVDGPLGGGACRGRGQRDDITRAYGACRRWSQ